MWSQGLPAGVFYVTLIKFRLLLSLLPLKVHKVAKECFGECLYLFSPDHF